MKAVMLAAGVGRRLYGDNDHQPPKVLLEFDGETLLARHIAVLRQLGVSQLVMVVGYREADIRAEVARLGAEDYVTFIHNPEFRRGPVVSLWCARDVLTSGDDILFMDADVLYPAELMARLIHSKQPNCYLLDRDFEPGAEPVKACLKGGLLVDFGKQVEGDFDVMGEWPGFARYSPAMAKALAGHVGRYVSAGRLDDPYEPAMRDLLNEQPPMTFAVEDITGMPWIEIDFPSDLVRAEAEIFRRIQGR